MKKMTVLMAILAFFSAGWALADSAVVTSAVGTVQAQLGATPARILRVGDEVVQGMTVSTGPASSVVLKFDDGQVAALTANSRMTISAYQYQSSTRTGNVLLSLVEGGMRAITGLIGKNSRDRVAYKAGSATIGIRGTDVTIITTQGHVVVTVADGVISFSFAGQSLELSAGQGIHLRPDGTFSRGTIAEIMRLLQASPLGRLIIELVGGINTLAQAINEAAPGIPRPGSDGEPPPTTPTPGGAGGGGIASPS